MAEFGKGVKYDDHYCKSQTKYKQLSKYLGRAPFTVCMYGKWIGTYNIMAQLQATVTHKNLPDSSTFIQ